MKVTELADLDTFVTNFATHAARKCAEYGLKPEISEDRLRDAYVQWDMDMRRISQFELGDGKYPDEFKQAGHIAYWIRRCQPVIDIVPKEGTEPDENDERYHLLMNYGNEFLSFDFGFSICALRNCPIEADGTRRISMTGINRDYILTISHFLKNKSVSPHALFLIYKALFLEPL